MAKRPITYENDYRGYPINTVKERGLGCDKRFLEKYRNHVDDMSDRHSKVMQVRFDLRYPSDGSVKFNPRHISRLGWYLTRHFDRDNSTPHSVDLRFRWSCEQKECVPRPHYHCVVLVNGNAIKSEYAIFKQVERYWRIVLETSHGGLVDYCNKKRDGSRQENGMMYRRGAENAQEILEKMQYQASYLAKTRDKDGLSKGAWIEGGSRLPKK
jgi:hypothetical protein